ncbi:hypothetical protein BBAD15_g12295 [Beauveria bassiana D1-5]|uniref:Uncharacterized protein n=1 Tax=Beauveria bassiana D1-5 TaxID=1245745 RepID=A0A0A2VNS5_BEABA|nr:hypothetical protein BBAD15_g12295 [Beauveria bassiana D1-5]
MGKQSATDRHAGAAKKKRARVEQHASAAPGYGGTNQLLFTTQQSRPSRISHEQHVSASGSVRHGQQPDHFMYGSQPQPATDGTNTESDGTGSEASLAGNGHDLDLAAAVTTMSSQIQSLYKLMQECHTAIEKSHTAQKDMRAAAQLHGDTVRMLMDWLRLNNTPSVSPLPSYDGTGPATFTPRNPPPGPPDQGGTDEDYLPLHDRPPGLPSAAWTAAHRENRSRQLVVVQQIENDRLCELRSLAAISSPNIARLLAVYHSGKATFSVQEHVDLDVLELAPLCEREIAAVFSQVLRGLLSLLVLGVGFRVACIRTTVSGAVKIVLDWSYEPTVDPHLRLAGTAYLAGFLEQVMHGLGGAGRDWSSEARDFLRVLAAGSLPAEWVRIIP